MKLDLLFWLRLGGTMHALLLIPLFLAGAFTYWEGPPKAPHYAGFFVICAVLCLAAVPPMWLGSKDGKPAS